MESGKKCDGMKFQYFYGDKADQYSFIRVPKRLVTDKEFASLTIQAKMLYGLLLDRMGIALKNKWIDQENRVYVIYPISDIQCDLNISKKKAIECMSELEKKGLLEKQARGSGMPSVIYLKNFAAA